MSGEASQLSQRRIEYLISIFRHSKKRGYARQYELIRDLGISKPTASLMVRKLRRVRRRFKRSYGSMELSRARWLSWDFPERGHAR